MLEVTLLAYIVIVVLPDASRCSSVALKRID